MVKKPYFSIVIPTFNRAEKLQFVLFCLLRQTLREIEIIVSDNCSTDKTRNVVDGQADPRVRYHKNAHPSIYSENLQNAINYARGKYIFIHSDDDLLPNADSLQILHDALVTTDAGFLRVNYLCISPDKKQLFFFNQKREITHNRQLPPDTSPRDIMDFLIHVDHYFITGLVYKNRIPKNVGIIPSEHAPWIAILLHVTKKYGAYFMDQPHVVASWSTWRNRTDGLHPVYSFKEGKLESEYYFKEVKKILSDHDYREFVHQQCMRIYVGIFPVIKILVGNRQLLALSERIRLMDPDMNGNIYFWTYLFLSLYIPGIILKTVKNFVRWLFMRKQRTSQSDELLKKYRKLEQGYLNATHVISIRKSAFFFT